MGELYRGLLSGGGAIFRGGLMEVSSPGRNSSVTGLGLCVDH